MNIINNINILYLTLFLFLFLFLIHLKKGDYLQIYDSFHDKEKKHSVHKSYKSLGYLDDLIASGIDDPISFYKAEVDKLNKKVKKEKEELSIKKIGESPVKNLGYFLIKAIFNKLRVKFHLDLLDKIENETLSTYNYLLNMVSARIINLSSKDKNISFADALNLNIDNYFFNLRMLKNSLI